MDLGSIGQNIIVFFLSVASIITGTIPTTPKVSTHPQVQEKEASVAYHYQLEGPEVHEATQSIELNSIEEEFEYITPTTPPLSTSIDLTKTVMGLASLPSPTAKSTITLTPTLEPTATPTIKPTSTPKPTNAPPTSTPTSEPIPTSEPSPIKLTVPATSQSEKPSLNSDLIFQLINDHRATKNLSPFKKDDELCKLAEYRKSQLYDEIFTNGKVHQGLYDLQLPYFITENMAHYPTEQKVVSWWLGSRIHRRAIEGNYTYSCGACNGNSCAQLFTNYTPKKY